MVTDVQNDFCLGGALAVPQCNEIIPVLNKYIKLFFSNNSIIFAARDWHPKKTNHFKAYGGKWPPHCVQRTKGARFFPGLKLNKKVIILSKGMNPKKDSYSVFDAFNDKGQSFLKILRAMKIEEIYISGVATDYCIRRTALDALRNHFKVEVLIDAVRGINLFDSENAVREMISKGAKLAILSEVEEMFKSLEYSYK